MPDIRPPGHTWRPFPMAREGPAKGAARGAGAAAGRKATLLPIPSLMAARLLSPRCAAGEDKPAVLTSSCRLKGGWPAPAGLPESSQRAASRPGSREWRSKHHAECAKCGSHRSLSAVDLGVVTVELPQGGYICHKGEGGGQ